MSNHLFRSGEGRERGGSRGRGRSPGRGRGSSGGRRNTTTGRRDYEYQLHLNFQISGTNAGYGEWIAEDQKESTVYIRSPEAQLITKFSYGLRQGKGFSCPLALLVGWELLKIWSLDLPNDPGEHPYQMGAKDPQTDSYPTIKAISYVDDNARYTTATTGNELCRRVQGYINHATTPRWIRSPPCRRRGPRQPR